MTVVGVWSFGLALCLIGAALLIWNLTGSFDAARLADFWGVLPLSLGVELLAAHYRAQRKTAAGEPTRVRIHTGGLAGLMALVIVAAAANTGLFDSGPRGFWAPWSWRQSYAREAVGTLSQSSAAGVGQQVTTVALDAPPGSWTIRGADVSEVTVEAQLTARAATLAQAQTAASGAKVVFVDEGSILRVRIEAPGYVPASPANPFHLSAVATLTVPRDIGLEFDSSTASVAVSDLGGRVNINTSTGEIEVRRMGGPVTARSSTGGILAEDLAGSADLSSSTGSVEAKAVAGDVEASSSTGWISVTDPGAGVRVDSSTGGCTILSAKPVAGDWSAKTSTGPIDISFPRGSDVTVRVRTGLGSISSNLGFSISSSIARKAMDGTLGQGTYEIDADATTGAMVINGTE